LSVGINIIAIPTWEYDRSELINDLRLEGAQQLVQANQLFSGNASTTEFTLSSIPEDLAVYYSAAKNYSTTAKLASEIKVGNLENSIEAHDYEVDKKNKTITFTSFTPASGTNNILVELSYYAPIPIHAMNEESITTYGTYAKTVTLTDVMSLDDAWIRTENLLLKYSQPFKSAKLKVLWSAIEGYTVTGSITPNATGNYFYGGTYSGYNYYRREDGAWYIWYNIYGGPNWALSHTLGSQGPYYWYSEDKTGSYINDGEATGTAIVSGLSLQVGQSIRVIDSINVPNVDQFFTVYKIIDSWPEASIDVEVGDKQYTIEEYQANTLERIKRLEETMIGTTEAISEIKQQTVSFSIVPESSVISIQNIEDSFILGHPSNAILGTSKLGWRGTTSSQITYVW
jgi:hypothetical protein